MTISTVVGKLDRLKNPQILIELMTRVALKGYWTFWST
jgi:hypothetical protein